MRRGIINVKIGVRWRFRQFRYGRDQQIPLRFALRNDKVER